MKWAPGSRASRRAVAAPIPADAPVTKATNAIARSLRDARPPGPRSSGDAWSHRFAGLGIKPLDHHQLDVDGLLDVCADLVGQLVHDGASALVKRRAARWLARPDRGHVAHWLILALLPRAIARRFGTAAADGLDATLELAIRHHPGRPATRWRSPVRTARCAPAPRPRPTPQPRSAATISSSWPVGR